MSTSDNMDDLGERTRRVVEDNADRVRESIGAAEEMVASDAPFVTMDDLLNQSRPPQIERGEFPDPV